MGGRAGADRARIADVAIVLGGLTSAGLRGGVRPWVGMTGALVIAGSDYADRPQLSLENPFSNVILLLIADRIGGYLVRLRLQAEQAVAWVARKEAAIAEPGPERVPAAVGAGE